MTDNDTEKHRQTEADERTIISAPGAFNRQYQDRLFKAIFGREEHKDWLLSLYNALNGSSYTDPSAIEINTIERHNLRNDEKRHLVLNRLAAEPLRTAVILQSQYAASGADVFCRTVSEAPYGTSA